MILKKNYSEKIEIRKKGDFKIVKDYIPIGTLVCYINPGVSRYDLFKVERCLIKDTFIVPSRGVIQIRKKVYSRLKDPKTNSTVLVKDPMVLWPQRSLGYYSIATENRVLRKAGTSETLAWVLNEISGLV